MEDEDKLAIVILVIGMGLGFAIGMMWMNNTWENALIDRGFASYHETTGDYEIHDTWDNLKEEEEMK